MPETGRTIEKFAFIGAQSVGKTTMTDFFRDRFAGNPHVVVLEEEARKYFTRHPNTTDKSIRTQARIQDQVLLQEQAAHANPETKLIISDRSVIDPIVLTSIWDTPDNTRKLLERVTDWLPTYTSFLLLSPADVPSVPDENRWETEEERLAIHNAFGEFCRENGLPVIDVSGTITERAEKVEEIIFEHLSDKTFLETRPQHTGREVAIIGGGFSGLSVASHLIQEVTNKGQRVGITLFEPNKVDESVPYNTALPPSFRLNHEANNMGVVNPYSKDAKYEDFYQWVQDNKDKELEMLNGDSISNRYQDFDLSDPDVYLPRSLYGYYLKDRFDALRAQPETTDYRFMHRKSLVTGIIKDEDGFTVFDRERASRFSNVVLCTGDYFNRGETNLLSASRPHEYLANGNIQPTDAIGILGSSLSAIETAINFAENGYEKITMVSRAGRLPKIRGEMSEYDRTHINTSSIEALKDDSGVIASADLMQLFKKEFDQAYAQSNHGLYQPSGINWHEIITNEHPLQQLDADIRAAQSGKELLWRSVLASTRDFQPDLWNSLSAPDCQRILQRHMSFILSYFAPMPLPQAEKLQRHLQTGTVELQPHILRYESHGNDWMLHFKGNKQLPVDHLIDARGYSQDASQNPLITSLVNSGLVEKHPVNGIRANQQSQITNNGEVVDNLYAIGAVLYGERPLNAATPSLTHYAKEIAGQIAENI